MGDHGGLLDTMEVFKMCIIVLFTFLMFNFILLQPSLVAHFLSYKSRRKLEIPHQTNYENNNKIKFLRYFWAATFSAIC